MSVREVKAWTVTCEMAYGAEGKCDQKNLGPFFAAYESEVPIPDGWGYRTLHDCGLTGYTRHDLICGNCIKRLGIKVND